MQKDIQPFHIALAVRDVDEAKDFYAGILGCELGRSNKEWIDFNLYGHQFVCHLDPKIGKSGKLKYILTPGHGKGIPVPHYGVILEMDDWLKLSNAVTNKVDFILSPAIRLEGEVGEQASMMFYDPTGNALEFKTLKDIDSDLFAS